MLKIAFILVLSLSSIALAEEPNPYPTAMGMPGGMGMNPMGMSGFYNPYLPASDAAHCEEMTVAPSRAGSCSFGVSYCNYPDVECVGVDRGGGMPVYHAHIKCDVVKGACPAPSECAKIGLSEKVRTALREAEPKRIENKEVRGVQ